ncbi:hypothetical protein GCM10010341_79280 [Streptomyces noursei]|nr:hypothetical protein GCM10010341_79280 [Streptomyces noursei]
MAETSGLAAAEAPVEEPVPMAGPRRKVACCEEGVPVEVLGSDYRRIMVAFDEAGGGALTARQTAVALGWDSSVPSRGEGARGRLKRLARRGWPVEDRPGRFTLRVPGPAAAAA